MDLEAPIFAYIYMLTRDAPLPIFIQIVNLLDLHLQGQRFVTVSAHLYWHSGDGADGSCQSPLCPGVSGATHCQDISRGVSLTMFLSEMKRVAFLSIAFFRAMCVASYMHRTKMVSDKAAIFRNHIGHLKRHPITYSLTLLL